MTRPAMDEWLASRFSEGGAGTRYTAAQLLANADVELSRAYGLLGDAADWIRYADVPMTAAQAARRKAMLDGIQTAKAAISEAKR